MPATLALELERKELQAERPSRLCRKFPDAKQWVQQPP
jgi:hypothetical protein